MTFLEEIVIETWGDFACFTNPAAKVERLTYPFPTPSAARGILSAIYAKPVEFYWQVNRIEVLNPIRYISFKRNEVKSTLGMKDGAGIPIVTDEDRTQRQTVALQDVRYRIAASVVPQPAYRDRTKQLYEQALRRIRGGKAFMQPSFGLREFVAYFEESDGIRKPIEDTLDAGIMLYDIFDLHDFSVSLKAKPMLTLYRAVMNHGVIEIPPYDSPLVMKGGAADAESAV